MFNSRVKTSPIQWFYLAILMVLLNPFTSTSAYECPNDSDDLSNYVKFYLYSSSISNRTELQYPNVSDPALNTSTLTKLITHGFLENPGYCNSTQFIIEAFKEFTNYNLILVDYSELSGRLPTDYPFVVNCVRLVISKYVGSFINSLVNEGVAQEDIHLIGHSLGAQLMGITTQYINFTVPRVTGLDPAGPFFDNIALAADKLDKTDAKVVDVIHTNSLLVGSAGPDGKLDFYMNGGTMQPQCSKQPSLGVREKPEQVVSFWHTLTSALADILLTAFSSALNTYGCDHYRSYQIFAISINPNNRFPSYRCKNLEDARLKKCNGDVGNAGYYIKHTEPGIYYTSTDGYSFEKFN